MAPNRHLPARHNPLLVEDVPPHAELAARRRLGQTQLTARMVQVVPGAEVDTTTLGAFDYAHLRAPLPKGIVSGIFKSSPNSYFLMRRSQDGFVSATGMFKATFPYAEQDEEEAERRYIKSLPTTSHEETAGNVWIPPDQALALAEEYKIVPWIRALLDPSDIAITGGADSPPKKIAPPPKFFTAAPALAPPTPASSTRTSRSRRSVSPTKSTGSKRAIASPRKRRGASSQSSITTETPPSSVKESTASPSLVNGETQSLIPVPIAPGNSVAKVEATEGKVKVESIEKEPAVVLEPVEEEPKVKVQVDEDVTVGEDGKEVKHTKVEVEVPLFGEAPSAEDAAKMVADAKVMVEAVVKTIGETSASASTSAKNKRKADDIAEDESEGKENAVLAPQPKKVKTEAEVRKETIRKRAYYGLGATFAVGAVGALLPVIGPYVMNAL
ncbi:hypothetical protein B0H66DRAFT_257398 [Apodospora peruviana]|uniref:HTH APSES-type domain-containing protein n=1 Tax=Apodospora peruviana TaxID=516989 RepID=A0AAE0M4X4_9PEZI|nr:hypothetical protein B0H66DRAFT_257398 [Apodospora peruviana]